MGKKVLSTEEVKFALEVAGTDFSRGVLKVMHRETGEVMEDNRCGYDGKELLYVIVLNNKVVFREAGWSDRINDCSTWEAVTNEEA